MLNPAAITTASVLKSIPAAVLPAATGNDAKFGSLLRDAVANVQQLETQASTAAEGLMRGDGVDIHTAMIATQKADLAFQLALSVRNKAVSAYQTLMGLQF
jgi:flagellar hook-basal body complex protein FliE